jgi:hypothetical protein
MYQECRDWRDAIQKAETYRDVGITELSISHDAPAWGEPWEYVTEVSPGGSHRLDIDTTVRFRADHPCGLSFSWWFDIEPRSANGSGHYQIDVPGVRKVLTFLPPDKRQVFQTYLTAYANSVLAHALEGWKWVQTEFQTADTLRRLGDAKP